MANTTGKYGVKPYGPAILPPVVFDVDPATTAIYQNDCVKLVADQGVAQDTAGSEASIGIAIGFFDATGAPKKYYPAGSATGWKCVVQLAVPGQLFQVKSTTALTAADVGTCADLVVGTGSTVTLQSGGYIDTVGTTTAQFKVLGLTETEGNAWGANQDVIVCFNEGMLLKTAGV